MYKMEACPNNIFLTSDKGQPLNEGHGSQTYPLFGGSIVAQSACPHLLLSALPSSAHLGDHLLQGIVVAEAWIPAVFKKNVARGWFLVHGHNYTVEGSSAINFGRDC